MTARIRIHTNTYIHAYSNLRLALSELANLLPKGELVTASELLNSGVVDALVGYVLPGIWYIYRLIYIYIYI